MSQFKGSPYIRTTNTVHDVEKNTVYHLEHFSREINQRCEKCLKRFKTSLFHEGRAREVCIDCIISERITDEEFIDLIEREIDDE